MCWASATEALSLCRPPCSHNFCGVEGLGELLGFFLTALESHPWPAPPLAGLLIDLTGRPEMAPVAGRGQRGLGSCRSHTSSRLWSTQECVGHRISRRSRRVEGTKSHCPPKCGPSLFAELRQSRSPSISAGRLFRWRQNRVEAIRRGLDSLQMRVPHTTVIIQRNGDELVFAFQQKLDRLVTLLGGENGFAQVRPR